MIVALLISWFIGFACVRHFLIESGLNKRVSSLIAIGSWASAVCIVICAAFWSLFYDNA